MRESVCDAVSLDSSTADLSTTNALTVQDEIEVDGIVERDQNWIS